MQTRQQRRAEKAYRCVSGKSSSKDAEEYLRLAKSFPALVHTCGLVQALAFVRAKDTPDRTGSTYLNHLSRVMIIDLLGDTTLDDKSRKADLTEYQYLSIEAIEAATWLKRYAEALLDKGSGQDGSAETPPESESS